MYALSFAQTDFLSCTVGTTVVGLTGHCECLRFKIFQQPCYFSLPLFSSPLKCLGQVRPFCFHCPHFICSCVVRLLTPPDITQCAAGMQLPEEFPCLPLVPNFTHQLTPSPITPLISSLSTTKRSSSSNKLGFEQLWHKWAVWDKNLSKKRKSEKENRTVQRGEAERACGCLVGEFG